MRTQLAFAEDNVVLLSGSEDGTAKLWNLSAPLHPMNRKKAFPSIEPVYTFMGHKSMVTATAVRAKTGLCYTGSADGRVLVWQLPTLSQDA